MSIVGEELFGVFLFILTSLHLILLKMLFSQENSADNKNGKSIPDRIWYCRTIFGQTFSSFL